jgi:hypothetical protein
MNSVCGVAGCGKPTPKPEHRLCLDHWLAQQGSAAKTTLLNPSAIAEQFAIDSTTLNKVLAELGWLEKEGARGWKPTAQGKKLLAEAATYMGNAFVKWPAAILSSRILRRAVVEFQAGRIADQSKSLQDQEDTPVSAEVLAFRDRFPATIRAMDGHLVRSRGELIIDNWLYTEEIVHAYERRVPINDELYCDFYIRQGNVYIEYWGLEGDSQYEARKAKKLALYESNELNLIQLNNKDIDLLDDVLPKRLRAFGVNVTD